VKKNRVEEEERKDAARHRQTVAATSKQLVEAFKSFSTPSAQAENINTMMEEKMAAMVTEIMQEIGVKMDESSKEVKGTLTSILGIVQRLADCN
jgi:hypothetical protein